MTVLSGMTFEEHIKENVETFSPLKPCDEKEFAALERAAKAYIGFGTIPCTRCNYCMPCPYGLDIPAHFAFRNEILTVKDYPPPGEVLARYRAAIPEPMRRAEHCTGCDRCAGHCPQSINISKEIAKIDEWIDGLVDREIAE
jgi:predicted aldo/keto reductase-like oxidoreductase